MYFSKVFMNSNKFSLGLVLVCFISISSFAQKINLSIEVAGVCGMCEERIENALDIKGITFADWSQETKICQVTFNASKITENQIHHLLAKVGHDTQKCRATDETYNSLHRCCHYDRAAASK